MRSAASAVLTVSRASAKMTPVRSAAWSVSALALSKECSKSRTTGSSQCRLLEGALCLNR